MVESLHTSVLLNETLELLEVSRGGTYVDATLGLGGHAEAILGKHPDTKVIGIDQDSEALAIAIERLKKFGERVKFVHANFTGLKQVLNDEDIDSVDGVLADLGVSSLQFDSEQRGFSFRFDAPLDMRMNTDSDGPTAADLLRTLSQDEIANLIYLYGEERFSRRIAQAYRRKAGRRRSGDHDKAIG